MKQEELRTSWVWHPGRWRVAAHTSLSRHCLRLLLLSRNHDAAIINNRIIVLRGLSMVLEAANETSDEAWRIRSCFTAPTFPHLSPSESLSKSALFQNPICSIIWTQTMYLKCKCKNKHIYLMSLEFTSPLFSPHLPFFLFPFFLFSTTMDHYCSLTGHLSPAH